VGLIPVATYARTVGASLTRVWENVLDWEHLPYLHRDTFAFVEVDTCGANGWTGRTALAWEADRPLSIEVTLDRPGLRYHTRTVAGPGVGTDILTELTRVADDVTGIHVTFYLPDVEPTAVPAVGQAYVGLYTRLWDEDEAMMRHRQAVLDGTRAAAPLALTVDGHVIRYSDVCPHLGGPLAGPADTDGCIVCPWHGYRFDARTGCSIDGRGLRLDACPTTR
jgi:nitrite reductase/ring-hydroxylating ferredoxin subunit